MFEDRERQDPLSRSEKYEDRNLPRRDQRKASPERKRETPGIKVIIKEEEDGWTVKEKHESYRSGADKEDAAAAAAATHPSLPQLKAYGKDRVKSRQRFNSLERRSEESRGPALHGHSSSAREGRHQRRMPGDSDARPEISCVREKVAGSENVDECNNTVRETSPGHRWSLSSCHRTQVDSSGGAAWSVDVRQSTSLQTEADPHPTRTPALCQTDSSEHRPPASRGRKMATSSLDGQTLRLTVRLQAGEEEEQEDEIGGLINSDGEVVEWDANAHQQSDCTESPQYSKGDGSSESQLHGQNQRERSSPTLIMEVVSVGEDEEMDEGEEGKKVAKMKSTYHGKRHRRKNKGPQIKARKTAEADKDASAKPIKRRGRRNISEIPLLSAADMEAQAGLPRRTRRKTRFLYMGETEELSPKNVRRVTAKRSYRKRKDSKQSGEGGANSSGKRGPGRKTIRVPLEIPAELLRAPKEKMEYLCSVCGKEFPHAYKLERHELVHTGEKPYNCSVCGRGFNQKGNLKTHYKVHLGRKGALEFEDEMNPVPPELADYLKSLPGESRIRSAFHCLECGKDCESQAALQAHYITTHALTAAESASIHAATQLIFCTRCGLHFLDNRQLEEHMKAHVKEKRYSCPDCGKMFINESYIQVHRRIHTGERPFLCSQCGRGFHTASSLKLHELHHSQERPFACNICGKTFLINSYLTAHYQTHLKERPFICNVCGKGYSRAEELKVHHRHHTGERPFKCEECGKSFIYRQGLRQHERTHGGKRIGPTRQLGRPKQQAQMEA